MGLFVIAAVRDITKRWQAQEELRLSEARFRSAFDAAGHGMVWIGLDSRFLKVNAAYCGITGYSEEELMTRTITVGSCFSIQTRRLVVYAL